jgi:hypothetical protein
LGMWDCGIVSWCSGVGLGSLEEGWEWGKEMNVLRVKLLRLESSLPLGPTKALRRSRRVMTIGGMMSVGLGRQRGPSRA